MQEKLDSAKTIELVHVQIGMTKENIAMTYIRNKKKDKSKMWRALVTGSMIMDKDISIAELNLAIENIVKQRELYGISEKY